MGNNLSNMVLIYRIFNNQTVLKSFFKYFIYIKRRVINDKKKMKKRRENITITDGIQQADNHGNEKWFGVVIV